MRKFLLKKKKNIFLKYVTQLLEASFFINTMKKKNKNKNILLKSVT